MPDLLTKSKFTSFLRCPCALWMQIYHKQLLPAPTLQLQKIFAEGREVDDLARELFPKGAVIDGYNETGYRNTLKALEYDADVLYQPTAVAHGLSARADILKRSRKQNHWDLIEVKASTKVKEEHIYDVGFQKQCFEQAGIKINKVFIVHLNNEYVRKGKINIKKLFTKVDVTEEVKEIKDELLEQINFAKEVFHWGPHLTNENLLVCTNYKYCDAHTAWLDSLPEEEREQLASKLMESIDSEPVKKSIDKKAIRTELESYEYPLYFLDYETYSTAIPLFDGTKPYQHVPFQFSVYKIEAPGETPETFDFLMKDFGNPIPDLLEALKEAIGPVGTIFAWYIVFEKGRNDEMAQMYPEYAEYLEQLNERVVDLMQIFKQGLYTDPAFNGSNSLKAIMPVLVPDLSYKNLAIQEGGTASASWPVLTGLPDGEEKNQLYRNMIDYCRLDVYGMVKILEVLEKECR